MPGTEQDRLTLAQIAGVIMRHARTGSMTGAQQAAALAELAEVANGRVDLLAEHAGVALAFQENDADPGLAQRVAQLCISAGADIALIEQWIGEGSRRAAIARQVPYRPGRAADQAGSERSQ